MSSSRSAIRSSSLLLAMAFLLVAMSWTESSALASPAAIEGGDQEKIEDDAEVVNGTSEIDAEKKSENLQEIRNRVVLVNGKTVDIEPKGKKKSGSLFGGNFGVLGYQEPVYDPLSLASPLTPLPPDPILPRPPVPHTRRRRRLNPLAKARRRQIIRRRLRNLLLGLNTAGDRVRPDAILGGVDTALPALPGEKGVGPYVAISGRPGQRVLHVINGRGGFKYAGTVSRTKGISVNGQKLNPLFEDFGYDYDLVVDGFDDPRLIPGLNVAARRPPLPEALPGALSPGLKPSESDPASDEGKKNQLSLTDLLNSIATQGGVEGIEVKTENNPIGTVETAGGSLTPGPNYLKVDFTDFAGYSAIPRCSYVNTDFLGDDVGDGKGISTGSAIACKQACQENNVCKFWSFRDGWARDCYLKRGRRGDPNPTGAIPKIGYVSGTKGNDDCLCLPNGANSDEEICPLKSSRPVFPWKNVDGVGRSKDKNDKDRPFRFDYDDYELGLAVDGVDDGLPLVEAPSGGEGPNLQGRFDEYEDFGRISENSSSSSSNSRNSRRQSGRRNRPSPGL